MTAKTQADTEGALQSDNQSDSIRATGGTNVAIHDELALAVKELWQRTLRVPHIKSEDDFFELGGVSLELLELVDVIEKRFEVRVAIAEFIDKPTMSRMVTLAKKSEPGR